LVDQLKSTPQPGPGRRLYEEIKARIVDGTYPSGSALPSTRSCADERGISRTTVSAVYEQLTAEGYLETRPGAASRVAAGVQSRSVSEVLGRKAPPVRASAALPRLSAFGDRVAALGIEERAQPPARLIDFAYGPLAGRDFPALMWAKAAREVARGRPARMAYSDPRGDLDLRRALQAYVARARGIACGLEQLVITSGSQQAIDLCARLLIDSGDRVVVESPGYRMAYDLLRALGAELIGVDVDVHGLCTAQLPRRGARLAYVTPTHQFPLGAFLTMARRHELLDWAAAADAYILEDDYDGEYRYAVRPEATLHSLDPDGRVIYVGTFSKTLSPQLRVGYAVLPTRLAKVFADARQLVDRHAPTEPQRVLARLIEDGSYERHVRRMRRLQQGRRQALLEAIQRHFGDDASVAGAGSGLHVVLWLNGVPSRRELEIQKAAERSGVLVHSLGPLYLGCGDRRARSRPAGLVLGYALLQTDDIDVGIRRLASAVRALT
jgi:GntR family transcriptional regulator/MocR family aminotransferase